MKNRGLAVFFAIAFGIPVLLGIFMGIAFGRGQDVANFPLVWMYLPAMGAMGALLWGERKKNVDGGETIAPPKLFYRTFIFITAAMVIMVVSEVFFPRVGLGNALSWMIYVSSILSLLLLLFMKKQRREAWGLRLTKNITKSLAGIFLFILLYLLLTVASVAGEGLLFGSGMQPIPLNPYLTLYLINLPISLLLSFTAFFGEEYGWRYYLQPILQHRFGKRWGVLLLGLLWGVWHLPINLFYYSPASSIQSIMVQIAGCIGMGIFFGWVYMRTENIWTVTMLHFLNNNLGITLFGVTSQNVEWNIGSTLLSIALYLIVYLPFLLTKEYREVVPVEKETDMQMK